MNSETLETNNCPTDLVTPHNIDASSIVGCVEITVGSQTIANPFHKEGGQEARSITPNDLIGRLVKEGWVVVRVMCYGDSHTNYGHEPAISHKTVVLLVKVK